MNKKRLIILAIMIVALVLILLLTRGNRTEAPSASTISIEIPVSVIAVERQKLASNISLVGTINANNDVNVVSETQGVAKEVFVKVGQSVNAGKVMIQIDDVLQRSNLATAEINYQKAQRDFERSETLYQENSMPPAQLDAARLALKAAENQQDIARRQLENTQIKSPISGTVNARFVNVGTMVQPGMPVVNIVDIGTLKARVNVPESDAFQLKAGAVVVISTDVYPGEKFSGQVDNIAAKADEAHTYAVEIVLPNSDRFPLKAGMFARIDFTSIAPTDALVIPRQTLIGSIKDAQVYQVQNGIAYLRKIIIGKQSNEYLEVLDGLSLGDTVVISGQNNLVDRSKVNIVGPQ